jgi:hypothetical protein
MLAALRCSSYNGFTGLIIISPVKPYCLRRAYRQTTLSKYDIPGYPLVWSEVLVCFKTEGEERMCQILHRHGVSPFQGKSAPRCQVCWLIALQCRASAFLKLFSSWDNFYLSECSTDHPILVPLERKLFEILNYSVWYVNHVNLIFSVFFGLMFHLRGLQGQNPRTTCGPRTTVWETLM